MAIRPMLPTDHSFITHFYQGNPIVIRPAFLRLIPITGYLFTGCFYQDKSTAVRPLFFRVVIPITDYFYQDKRVAPRTSFFREASITDYLFKAVEECDISLLQQLFKNPIANPNCRNAAGTPLLVYAAERAFIKGMQSILAQPGANPNLRDRKGWSALHSAVEKGYNNVVDYLVNDPDEKYKHFGLVNINPVADNRETPLLLACHNPDLRLLKMLVDAGAWTDWPGPEGYTAKAIVVLRGWDKQIGSEIPMDPFTDEFLRRKYLAHCNGIGGSSQIDEIVFPLEGSRSFYMHQMLHKQLQDYFQRFQDMFSDEHKGAILEAFEQSASNIPAQDLANRIQMGYLTILPTGWLGHAVDVVFFEEYMAICNLGETVSRELKTIEVFKITQGLVTKEIIYEIRNQKKNSFADGSAYFYFNLPAKLAGPGLSEVVQDDLCRKISEFAPKPFELGMCAYGAPKAAFRVSMMLLEMTNCKKSMYHALAAFCREVSKRVSTFMRLVGLDDYLHFHLHEAHLSGKKPLDESLVRRCFSKITKHVNTTEGPMRQLFQADIKDLEETYPQVFLRALPEFHRINP